MKQVKLVALSMSVLGLISYPALADNTNTTTKYKHKKPHHHHVKHREMVADYKGADYKAMGALPVAEPICAISPTTIVMDQMNQNTGRSMPSPCNPRWFDRIAVSGGLNVDMGKWGRGGENFQGEDYQRFALNDAYLNIAATVNDWTKVFTSLSYGDASGHTDDFFDPSYSNVYGNRTFTVEQAYVTVANWDMAPVFVQVGKQFQDFSRYEIHPITRSMTQVMSEILATSAKVGFVTQMGINGSAFIFDDRYNKIGHSGASTNYGLALGFDQPSTELGYDVGVAYIYNMITQNDVGFAVNNFNSNVLIDGSGYHSRVGAYAVYADVNSGPFSVGVRYTAAAQRFSPMDLPEHGRADVTPKPISGATLNPGASGAKPWAAGIEAGYGFNVWDKNQNVYVGYQASGKASGLALPENRWLLGYDIELWRSSVTSMGVGTTNLGIEWDHDGAYSASKGGNGDSSNLVSLRAAVKFG